MDNHQRAPTMEFPHDFRCPISMEPMKEPVTISTGVTYERKNIEKWFLIYKKNTCPATMQHIDSFDITPNYTLKRLINSWKDGYSPSSSSCSSPTHHVQTIELVSIMKTIESTPFKVTCLKKLKSILETGDEMACEFKKLGGVEVLIRIIEQVLVDAFDFIAFRACEEALSVLHQLPFSSEDETVSLLMKPECLKSMAIMLQRGSTEARLCTVSIFEKMGKADNNHWNLLIQDQGIDVFKSLLEMVSDEISRKASSCALQVLIQILKASKKSRLKAIEAGAICTLIELIPDSTRSSKCEKIMYLIKLMCECADGRLAFVEHGLGIAIVSKKLLNISSATTKICVKILWLVCNFHPSEKVLEEMLFYGSMKKLVALLHIGGEDDSSTTKERVVKILKLHANSWSRYPCFPREMKEYLGLGRDFC